MDLPLSFIEGTFAFTSGGTPEDLKDAIVSGLQAVVEGDNILLGKIGGSQPTDGRIWLNNGTWYYFDGSQYRPVLVKIGTAAFQITLIADPTANRTQTLQNKSGTIALTSDIYTPRATKILSTTTPAIDWSLSNSFFQTIGANVVYSMTNSLPGQRINLIVNSIVNSVTTTFPSSVYWTNGGVQGAQTNGVDRYEFDNIAGTIYGSHYENYA